MKKKIFIAGHNGMVGSAILGLLKKNNELDILTSDRSELDLINQKKVSEFFEGNKIDEVYLAAAKVGGIQSNNKSPVEFLYENLMIQNNIIISCLNNKIKKLLFLGSSCIYPRLSFQPIKESYLLSGFLEPTNEAYALAKITGIKLCESINQQYGFDYRSVMPTNLFGPNDNFNDESGHVIPALIRRVHLAKVNNIKEVSIWGTGNPKREFLHVQDMARACIHVMDLNKENLKKFVPENRSHINIGTGEEVSIKELAYLIKEIIDYKGKLRFDKTKPDGTPRKLLDIKLINDLGWKSTINLKDGLIDTYEWFIKSKASKY